MPHECTNCGRAFPDGSKEMLSGCPDCGGNKFQFVPSDSMSRSEPASTSGAESEPATDHPTRSTSSAGSRPGSNAASRADVEPRSGRAAPDGDAGTDPSESATSSDFRSQRADRSRSDERSRSDTTHQRTDPAVATDDDRTDTSVDSREPTVSENAAQADARSEVVSRDDLPSTDEVPAGRDQPDSPSDTDDRPEHGRIVSEPSGESLSIEQLRAELNEQFEGIKIVRPGQYELNLVELYDREEYIVSLQEDGRYVIDVPDSWREGTE